MPVQMTRHRGNTTVAFSEFRRCHGPGPEEILSSMGSGHDSTFNIHREAHRT